MLLKGSFVPKIFISSPWVSQVIVRTRVCFHATTCSSVGISSPFREPLPVTYHKWKGIDAECKEQAVQQSTTCGSNLSPFPELSFDRLQLADEELLKGQKHSFGRYVARGAVLDEEYWTAAWLRAEAHWESMSYMRHVVSFKQKYAEQEFYALKRRCLGRDGNSLKCFCIVTVKKEDPNIRRTVLNSVVGTLDVSIRQFMQGESWPGESKPITSIMAPHIDWDGHRYAYIANVCVSKFARRQGIATNMLHLATDFAISSGMKQLFIHVNADNRPAQDLYRKAGFKLVEPPSKPSNDQLLLMLMEL